MMAAVEVDNQVGEVSETLESLIDLITEESPLTRGMEEEIEAVAPELRALQTLVEAAESDNDDEEEELILLAASIKELSLLAKTQIGAFILSREKQMKRGKLHKCISILGDAKVRSEFMKILKVIKVRVRDIIEQLKRLMTDAESSSSHEEAEHHLQAISQGNNVIGREQDIARVRTHLSSGFVRQTFDSDVPLTSESGRTSSSLSDNTQALIQHIGKYFGLSVSSPGFRQQVRLSAVSIVGSEGVGKTTMASLIYKDAYVSRIFSSRVWVTVPHEFQPEELLSNIAKQVITVGSDEPDKTWSLAMLRESIHFSLTERPYLIVLDNVQTPEVWRLLRQVLPNTGHSKVLITTRVAEVATEASSSSGSIHHLQELTPPTSWRLFCTILGDAADELQPLAREIVENCRGIPLLILETGGILSWEAKTVERWSTLLSELQQKGSLKHLVADALPSYLKKCLYSLLLYDKDFEVPTRRITALWIAEGLVQPKPGNEDEPLEAIAKEYLLYLKSYFVIEVLKNKSNGEIKTCRLRPAIRSLLILKAKANNFFYDHIKKRIRRLAHHPQRNTNNGEGADDWSLYRYNENQTHGSSTSYCFKYLRTFSSSDPREGPGPGEHIKYFLHRGIKMGGCKRLRILDLEGVFRPILPEVLLKELKQLRYVSLRRTYAEVLPASVGSLRKLQTLDLKHTCISMVPISIWKLKELRHLYLGESYRTRLPSHPSVIISLNNLQTLSGGYMDDQTLIENELGSLKSLRKLALTCQMSMEKHKELGDWIVKLTDLKTLRLRSIDEMIEPSRLYIERLSGLNKLNSLYLFGGITQSILSTFPDSLTEITLSLSKLEEDPMPVLGGLSNLKSLSLLSDSYIGSSLTCLTSSFPVLRFLKLWKLTELEKWIVDERALPVIEAIEIRSCRKLKFITQRMEYLTSFQ